ncbi:AMIN-like domain-containing (lipo)protein [Cryobacterium tagatosivorans]|uniref:AMIN-like domain-containing (lipo)protein n=1 Tax=Cryobacterium tagatosivorans TaxID=1259199 RepID=UPI00141B3361|nr:hypothetical protein [Cryobacterium tagatosivorans]
MRPRSARSGARLAEQVAPRRVLVPLALLPVVVVPVVLALAACTTQAPIPGDTHASPTSTASPTTPGSSTPTPTTTPPPDDEPAPPDDGDRVISSRIAKDWGWPGPGEPYRVAHENEVPIAPPPAPPLPYLYSIAAGAHPSDNPPYNQLSFRFQNGFPSYDIEYVPKLIADGSGANIPMPGTNAILRVVFRQAQAHLENGTSSIVSAPAPVIGYPAITRYASGGDFEGYVSYGIGVGRPADTNPQTRVRVYEVEKIELGRHLYVVAIQIDATPWR